MNDKEKIGIVLIHGFTGSDYEMEPLEQFLHDEGYIVNNILLPGHGTTPEDHKQHTWVEWIDHAQQELDKLKSIDKTFVVGLSMGAAITYYLAVNNPGLDGIIGMAGPIKIPDKIFYLVKLFPFIKYLKPWNKAMTSYWEDEDAMERCRDHGYDKFSTKSVLELDKLLEEMRVRLPLIAVPTLILHAEKDTQVPPNYSKEIYEVIPIKDKEIKWIERGGHVIPMDAGYKQAFEIIREWLEGHL